MSESGRNIFGTDGIRGVGGEGLLAAPALRRIGSAVARFAREESGVTASVLIGRDTRLSGPRIAGVLADALRAGGLEVEVAGVLPTPAVSLLVAEGDRDLGVVISASHNPPEFNGIKVLDGAGRKLRVDQEQRITAWYDETGVASAGAAGSAEPEVPAEPTAESRREEYLHRLLAAFDGAPLTGTSIVLDCAFGAAAAVAANAFRAAGARVTALHEELDGARINIDCGSLDPRPLGERVVAEGAALGVAFDGDADRAIFVDENGAVVDGDEIMAIWALELDRAARLADRVLVCTVMSNAGMERHLVERGIRVERTGVGDREVFARMEELGATLGGEQSGHIIFRPEAVTGDGVRTGLHVARTVVAAGRPLSELRGAIPRYPQVLLGVEVEERVPFAALPDVVTALTDAEQALAGHGRVLLRYSGTEPLARVLVEGRDPGENDHWAQRIADAVRLAHALPRNRQR